MAFWAEMEKLILKVTGNCQMPQTTKKNDSGPLSDIIYKNQLKLDQRPEYKTLTP